MSPEAAVDDYLRQVTVERGLAANTVAAYRRDLAAYCRYLNAAGIRDVGEVGQPNVAAFASQPRGEEKATALAASSQARLLSSVRGLHRFLVAEGITTADPAAEVKPPKLGLRLPKAISIEQMEQLLSAVGADEPAAIRDRALLELLYATGARVSEVVGLNVDDLAVASETGELLRVNGKGGKQRIVPVGSYARAALDRYLVRVRPAFSRNGPATPALFLGVHGNRLSRQSVWLIIRAAAERAELPPTISPHTFRHSFATHLLAGGADVRVVQELLGHSSVATTQIYTLVTADTLRDIYTQAHPRAR